MAAGARTARRRAPATASRSHQGLAAIPTVYRDVWMRSRLEARWAACLDSAGLAWAYEPQVLRLGRGRGALYLPDFWLPDQQTWLEVKGPHWERFEKTRALARRLGASGQVLVATASGVCWRVPPSGRPSQEEVHLGRCACGTRALGTPSRGTLGCRNPGCGGRAPAGEVLGW
jgi:uncharacterized SAM-binding protein YcdF (DUF218 family)